MDRTERFYRIDRLIRTHQCVPVTRFLDELEISLATFKRDIEYMRSRLHAPIIWDRQRNGYRFTALAPDAPRYELPGLWFNASEAYALLTMLQLLRNLEPGMLAPRVEPLRERLKSLLGSTSHAVEEIEKRIRILHMTARRMKLEHFEVVATALLGRRRLHIVYFSRGRNEESERDVSPQRLVHYRDNWYLDAWCHRTDGLRIFALDCVRAAHLLDDRAKAVPERELAEALEEGYGIFSGRARATALIRFSPGRARWVSGEEWHPRQVGRFEPDGSWTLEFPYSDDRELLMDILRHVPEVEVLGPPELKQRVNEALQAGLERNK
ncbi:MAG TPA: WYL domain-containing protein [Burkholderiales bacterium]|nr:WYL domain-containing protein [Burkholderiales bacterium]